MNKDEEIKHLKGVIKGQSEQLRLHSVSNRLWGVFCTYDDEEGQLISVHKTEEGAIKNSQAQTDYQQNYYHTDFVVLWD